MVENFIIESEHVVDSYIMEDSFWEGTVETLRQIVGERWFKKRYGRSIEEHFDGGSDDHPIDVIYDYYEEKSEELPGNQEYVVTRGGGDGWIDFFTVSLVTVKSGKKMKSPGAPVSNGHVKMRKELYDDGISVPVGDDYYHSLKPLRYRYNIRDEMEVYYKGEWKEVVGTDWEFVSPLDAPKNRAFLFAGIGLMVAAALSPLLLKREE